MTSEKNKLFIQQYLDALSGKTKPASMVNHYIADEDQELKQYTAMLEVAFPAHEIVASDVIAEDDKVVVRATFRGQHIGDFMGIPPTGRQVNVSGIVVYRILAGKIVEHWMQSDTLRLLQQLDVVPDFNVLVSRAKCNQDNADF